MLIRDGTDYPHERVADDSLLAEVLHPHREPLPLSCSIAHAIVPPGETTRPHRLVASTEVYMVVRGTGRMHVGDETAPVRAGTAILIPPGAVQWIENTGKGPLVFFAIVDPAWRADDEQVDGEL
jgi:cytosine deaminase